MAAVELKDRLLADGLVMHEDFEWTYSQATYNHDGFSAVNPRQVIFSFRDPALATFYQLKWS